jgi:hypothetical protein
MRRTLAALLSPPVCVPQDAALEIGMKKKEKGKEEDHGGS